jgi:tetratricopeptide (TPR) repeat protein
MSELKHAFPWRTVAGLALLLLASGPAAAADLPARLVPIEAALKAGDRVRADRLSEALGAEIRGAARPTLEQAGLLYRLEGVYRDWGYYARAEEYTRELVDLCDRLPRADDTPEARVNKETARLQANMELAVVYRLEEDYVRAGSQYLTCQQILDGSRVIRADDPVRWRFANNMGRFYELTGQYDEAETWYRRGLDFLKKLPAAKGEAAKLLAIKRATTLNNLGWLYHARGEHQKALENVEAARKIREKELPADDDAVAESLNNLGLCLYSLGRSAEAKPLLKRAVDILRDKHGPSHPAAAHYEHNLAALCRSRGEFVEAARLHKNSIAVLAKALGDEHPDVAVEHGYLAWLDAAQDNWSEAAVEIDQARRLLHNHIRHVLSAQSENEQLRFLTAKDQPWFHVALTIALKAGADPATNALAVNWVLNGKGVTPEVLGERYVLARQSSGDATVRQRYQQLLAVRGELAARSVRGAAPADDGDALRGAKLARQEEDLSRELGLALKYKPAAWVEVPEVQRVLAKDKVAAGNEVLTGDAVLIDFAKFTLMDFKTASAEPAGKEQHYAAWVVPPEGPAQVVDLGPAEAIDAAVQRLQETMREAIPTDNPKDGRTIVTLGERASEELYVQRSKELGRLLLGKLYPYAGPYRRWVISPDDNLWLVPWAAVVLPSGDQAGHYAVEKHTISLVSSGRDLVAEAPRGVRRTDPLIFASADFGEVPDGGRSKLLFGPLKYSAAEADAVRPSLKRYTGAEPVVLSGEEASEKAFRRARSPQAVVLSTHGFFLEKEDGDKLLPGNPFLRCGLALAGANRRDLLPAVAKDGRNDGVLFGLEILDTDLRGTDLVVLSACETALGQVHSGEGVANLQSAFQLAGAQAVVGTLWEVQDKQTGRLMRDFFRHLADDRMDKAEALRQAQLDRIKERRASPGKAAHPFFWAAPTVTGQWARTLDE